MEYKGVKLYGEVQQFQNVCGNLLSFYCPPNTSALEFACRDISACINALFDNYVAAVQRNYPDGDAGTLERKKHNWTVSQLKRDKNKFTKEVRKRLRGNIWRG